MENIKEKLELLALGKYNNDIENLSVKELYDVVGTYVISQISQEWRKSNLAHYSSRRACYFSAEYLVGKPVYKNLLCLGIEEEIEDVLNSYERSIKEFESLPDELLGNGGLGRLAACFLDSAANLGVALDGYGIRYRFGLFKQTIENGFQIEKIEDSIEYNDPWCVPCREDKVKIHFADGDVLAVPFDMPVISFKTQKFSNLRLWQSESVNEFDFKLFNEQKYTDALKEKNDAENISRLLYPNDSTDDGKKLRFKQQYFFTSASLQDIIRKYKKYHCDDYCHFAEYITIQLNDTHPVVAIAELIRLLTLDGCTFDYAFDICKEVFNYTNHTIMAEALEKWDLKLIDSICPDIARIIINIDKKQQNEGLKDKSVQIIQNGMVNMAYLACYVCKYINGVASLHTELLKSDVLSSFFNLYPQKFQNKTNGITQRRFLRLCNPKYSSLITELLGSDDWIYDLSKLKELEKYAQNKDVLDRFIEIKKENKRELANYIRLRDNDSFSPDFIVDSQIKRLHEYKRQLLNILVILELYFEIKEKSLKDFTPTVFIFGAKSAPGYDRAKGIIKLINEVKRLVEADEYVSRFIKIIFVSDYSVSYAEKIIPASDVSEQISTAGTEASGTGNMKFMLNGAVTLGTYDGANIEIVERAGEENNYIFGARVEDIRKIQNSYNPESLYENDAKIKRCLDALVDGTLSDNNTGIFEELYNSLLKGASWHKADNYYLLLDFEPFLNEKLKLNLDYKDKYAFAEKCFRNTCAAGYFSSDRTIEEYCNDIWKITKEG